MHSDLCCQPELERGGLQRSALAAKITWNALYHVSQSAPGVIWSVRYM